MKKIISTSVAIVLIGGFAFSAYVAETKNFENNKSYNAENIETLKVYNDSWDVRFKKSNSKGVTVSAEGKQKGKDPVTFKKVGEALVIKQKEQKNSGFFGGFTFGKKGTIYINVPKSGINNIELTNKDGDIQMSEISTNSVVVQNNSGDGKIKGVSANTGKFVSRDGMLRVEDSSFKKLNITSTSGDNYMKGVNSSKAKVTSADGEVSINGIKEGKSLVVDTESGDIGVSYNKAPTSLAVTAKSNSSDITLNLDGLKKNKDTEELKKGKIGQGNNKLSLSSNDGVINVTN
ncbi:DUF4097 family beta strand repeat-containing protein [Peribacillus sp. NPDC006672]|uniref:DUF4097 family beta strand repeat-containing protein n=1 Tax=Peribacillus sp. NPDC006672 TaxID=3390606 RepID=UPI003CFFB98E